MIEVDLNNGMYRKVDLDKPVFCSKCGKEIIRDSNSINLNINVLTNYGDIAYYDYNDNCWIAEPISAEIDPPIAWCEIPEYRSK